MHLVFVAGTALHVNIHTVRDTPQHPARTNHRMEQAAVLMLVWPSAIKPAQHHHRQKQTGALLNTLPLLLPPLLVVFAAAHRQKLHADPLQSSANGCLIDDLCEQEGRGDA